MSDEPSRLPNRSNRDANGRFLRGCPPGPGNPHGGRTAKLRAALLSAITPADVKRAAKALIGEAAGGNVLACRELLDRCIGKPVQADLLERVEKLEFHFAEDHR